MCLLQEDECMSEEELKLRDLREKRKTLIDEVLKNSQEILASTPASSQEQILQELCVEDGNVDELLRAAIQQNEQNSSMLSEGSYNDHITHILRQYCS